ncbi:bactofilin family protein [Paenibacillus alkalitolerans]|uniref:hypothetical protein n=1 Tax=Paenibacillus alkalitolerans TaxID=2799335 RepID=UPI0018F3282A|nr:hypothetical protein [Paenibacillus alkalitolerans]
MSKTISIRGHGSVGGGAYDKVSVYGNGTVNGDLKTAAAIIRGHGVIEGNLIANRFSIAGSSIVNGNIDGEEIIAKGSFETKGSLTVKSALLTGSVVLGPVRADQMKGRGNFKFRGNIECEEFFVKGVIQAQGLINAQDITLELVGESFVADIGGETITIKGIDHSGWFRKLFNRYKSPKEVRLKAEVIEGTTVDISNVEAKTVRSSTIRVGPHCRIDMVEYTESLQIDPTAEVRNKVKS